jgi:hypothetical protein
LWPATATELLALTRNRSPDEPVFLNHRGQAITRHGIHRLVSRYEQRLAEIDKELLGKTDEVEELVDAETEELSSSKTLPVDQEITDNNEIVRAETIEDKSPAQVAFDDAPGESLEVAAMQTPRFKRRQTADRGR